jgi:hypothetical protein
MSDYVNYRLKMCLSDYSSYTFRVFLEFVFILKPNYTFSVLKCDTDNMCTVEYIAKECC